MSWENKKNCIVIKEMRRPADVSCFIKMLEPLLDEDEISINITAKHVLPAACVPICGIIDTLKC